MANQRVSLAYYVFRAKMEGVTYVELTQTNVPYLDILSTRVKLQFASMLWNGTNAVEDVLVPLSEIDIPWVDYFDVVGQIFQGVSYRDVCLTVKTSSSLKSKSSVTTSFFPKYLETIPSDTRTGPAVSASLERVKEVLTTQGVAVSRANGLIVGRVQSGKTRNYIGLMLKAVDEGWNVILVLTSCNTFLAKQTRDRIDREFTTVGANNPQRSRELNFMASATTNCLAGDELSNGFFYWGVAMKEINGLQRIRNWLDIPNQPIASMRVLIVDDESDNATPDSNAGGQGLLDDEAITEHIDGIRRNSRFVELADWFDTLLARDWPELGAKTHEADVFGEINDLLTGNSTNLVKMNTLINGGEYRHLLGMDQFANPPVENLISEFFNHSGRGDDSPAGFVLLFRSILDVVRGRSAINHALCSLVGPNPETGEYAYPFQNCVYLGYTATPYANILNEGPGHTPIYADFIQSLQISPQYFGTEAIFGIDVAMPEPRMPIINSISDVECNGVLLPLQGGDDITIDADLCCKTGEGGLDWVGLQESIAWVFCTASARRHARLHLPENVRNKVENRWTTMLVNIDHKQSVHKTVCDLIDAYLQRRLATPESRAIFIEQCHQIWLRETVRFTAVRFNQLFNEGEDRTRDYGAFADYPTWDDVLSNLDFFISDVAHRVHVVVMNCTTAGNAAKQLYNQDPLQIAHGEVMELTGDHLWIVSGGNTISRGLTLSGLTTSYFERLRSGTCVDTITQMGRWFGYRTGYELLPRIWMTADTVIEMKRIAVLERKLHASIADNFAQHFSPSDPAHFQQITSWGRQLSGRAFAQRNLDTVVGTIASTGEFYRDENIRRQIIKAGRAFLNRCGEPVQRDPQTYAYASTPLWECVPRVEIQNFLTTLLPLYPEKARRLLRGLLREISASENPAWDVAIGNPNGFGERQMSDALGPCVNCAEPQSMPIGTDTLRFSARLHMAFYAMIPTVYLNREDVSLLTTWRLQIFNALDAKRIQSGGTLPAQYDAALPGTSDEPLRVRFDRLIDDLHRADGKVPLPEPIHARLGDISHGFRNRSSGEYMAKIHRAANHTRPTLQLLLVRPNGEPTEELPYVSVSFYWPNHEPTGFFTVSVDENPDFVTMVTKRGFCQTVEDILRTHDFPMQRRELLCEVLMRLGPRCNENFFENHIAHPLAGYTYHKMKGRNAYCIDGWATDEESRLGREFAAAAIDVLQRSQCEMTAQELLDRTIDEQPKFRDFFTKKSELTSLLTEEILSSNDVTVVRCNPITYKFQA